MSVTIQFEPTNNPAITSANLYEANTPGGLFVYKVSFVITPTTSSVTYISGVTSKYYYLTFVNTLGQESDPSPIVSGAGGELTVTGDIIGYSSVDEVNFVIAQALTQGTADPTFGTTPVPLINMGELPTTTVQRPVIEQYIKNADTVIDGYLSSIYDIPLHRIVNDEQSLTDNTLTGSNILKLTNTARIMIGDKILLMDTVGSVYVDILLVYDRTTVQLSEAVTRDFTIANGAKVQMLRFPDPIPLISARLAAGNLYDKYFAAQQSPNMSDYGDTLRKISYTHLNSLLNGREVLIGQTRTGKRFYNPELLDTQVTSAPDRTIDLL